MLIAAVETLTLPDHPEYLWVRLHTDDGIVGTGETMPRVGAVRRVVHDVLAPLLIGSDPARIELAWTRMFQATSYHGYGGAEQRALSAIDTALWDLAGRRAGVRLVDMLGGACRDELPVYNTCVSRGPYRDHERFLDDPAGLAKELVADGWRGMKIWPFDELSSPTLGQSIDRHELDHVLRLLGGIRDAVGDDIEIAIEGHACWNLPSAVAIAEALEPLRPMWLEDLIPPHDVDALVRLRASTSTPICGSERLFSRFQFAPIIDRGAVDVVMPDVAWVGGVTEFRKIAAHASTKLLPIAPHNCHAPVAAAATLHVAAACPNLQIVEVVRAFADTFYDEIVDGFPPIGGGVARVPDGPGLGVELREDVVERAQIERTESAGDAAWSEGDPWRTGNGERI